MPKIDHNFNPDRVVINSAGDAKPSNIARSHYGIKPVIIFLRNDGWTLAAGKNHISLAYRLWAGEWTHFVEAPDTEWRPIEEFRSRKLEKTPGI
jgi:hypothetical protein